MQVYATFEEHLSLSRLRFSWEQVVPASGFPGVPMGNRADAYEGGFRLYHIEHAAAPTTWTQSTSQLQFR
jgi:hypothetical protein